MKKKILFGSLIASVMLVLISIAPSINANVDKPELEVVESQDKSTPLALAFQLINKLRHLPGIENIETRDDLLQIIESDEGLNRIYEKLLGNDCDCEDDTTPFEWPYPIICFVFGFPLILLALLAMAAGQAWVGALVGIFGELFNCFWY